MLTPGSRIGPAIILRHIREGLFGDAYKVEVEAGRGKGENFLVKVLPRELVEGIGFSDNFLRECQVIEQLDQDGIAPLESYGVTKWKHWLRYDWEPGLKGFSHENDPAGMNPSEEPVTRRVSTLEDYFDVRSGSLPPDQTLAILTSILNGLRSAHSTGLIHGNLKPSNVLVGFTYEGGIDARLSEFCLARLTGDDWFRQRWRDAENLQANEELPENLIAARSTFLHRSLEEREGGDCDESGDLFAVGLIARRMLTGCGPEEIRSSSLDDELPMAWNEWLIQATAKKPEDRFRDAGRAIVALPGIGDVTRFGLKPDEDEDDGEQVDAEELRRKREEEWEIAEQARNRKALRGITGIVGGVFLAWYLFSTIYHWLYPTPWVEYKHAQALDSYQMGVGLMGGKAYGVTPKIYDPHKVGGQDVPGEWSLEDGLLRLHFRKYKHVGGQEDGKKRWKDMGLSSSSSEEYFVWTDYLRYDRGDDALILVKRVGNEGQTYRPVSDKDGNLRFFPEDRMGRGSNRKQTSELRFEPEERGRSHWALFFGIGFLAASFLYRWETIPVRIKTKKSGST